MSKLLEIENKIKNELDQTKFQKLCETYFAYEYPDANVNGIGASHGQNTTTTGTPDIRIDLKNGKYIFVECTIQKTGILKKFKDDLDKCFDETKTGIKNTDIQQIYVCQSTKALKPAEKNELENLCSTKNILIDFVNIDTLKFALFKKYKMLAKEFLDIELDTFQVLPIIDFITESQRKTTTLQNPFFARTDELNQIVDYLENNDIVLVSGKAGVGKTRLSIVASQNFKETHQEYEIIGIHDKGLQLYNDLQTNFIDDKKYIILIDDANRLNEFIHIANLVYKGNFKLIITVRDYALDKIYSQLNLDKFLFKHIEIQKLKDETIKEILNSLKITNDICVDNITRIADGNPRLVLMSADFVLKENNCNKLHNVTDIYDNYFAKILTDISGLQNDTVLKVLGIVCFFRIIDRENKEQMDNILLFFEIEENDFWENVYKLHDLELVNLYEKQIVKISEQVLATYFFYYVFIKTELLNYSVILDYFLDDYSGKVKENLYPILNHFGYEEILKKINKHIDRKLQTSKKNHNTLLKFYDIFWFCKQTDLLLWLQEIVNDYPDNKFKNYDFSLPDNKHINWDKNQYFELLKHFSQQPTQEFRYSLEIVCEFGIKKPELIQSIISYLTSEISFKKESYNLDYYFQTELFNYLINQVNNSANKEFFKGLIFSISNHFLKLHFDDTRSGRDRNTITFLQLHLIPCNSIKNLRKLIWEFLYSNYNENKEIVFEMVDKYVHFVYPSFSHHELGNKLLPETQTIRDFDEQFVIQFFENLFDNSNFLHCKLLYDYLIELKSKGKDISNYQILEQKYKNRLFDSYLALDWNYYRKRRDVNTIKWEDFEKLKKEELNEFSKTFCLDDYIEIINQLETILGYVKITDRHNFYKSIHQLLLQLLEKDINQVIKILEYVLKTQNTINLQPYPVLTELVNKYQNKELELFQLIENFDFNSKSAWKLQFFASLPPNQINQYFTDEFLKTIQNLETGYNIHFKAYEKFKDIQPNIFVCIIQILMDKTQNSDFKFTYYHYDFFENYKKDFEENLQLFKQLYFYSKSNEQLFDYEGKALAILLQLDDDFIVDYLQFIGKDKFRLTSKDDNTKLDFIWELSNSNLILEKAFEFLIVETPYFSFENYANSFFPVNSDNPKIINFISDYIRKNYAEKNQMQLIFNVILHSYPNKRIDFVKILVEKNIDLEFIRELQFIPISRTTSGNFVPHYEEDKKFWKEMEKLFSTDFKFMKLRKWTQEEQNYCDKSIDFELKRTFMNEY